MFPASPTSTKDALLARLVPVLQDIKGFTASAEIEQWLNRKHGIESDAYKDLSTLLVAGVKEGWAADLEIAGPRYRRSLVESPVAHTLFFSVTAVLLDSTDNVQDNLEGSFRGGYHAHPYGEFNLVIPLDEGAALAGPNGWCYGGWTAPAPGSAHFPEVKGGAVLSLTFLPAGRISFDIAPPPH